MHLHARPNFHTISVGLCRVADCPVFPGLWVSWEAGLSVLIQQSWENRNSWPSVYIPPEALCESLNCPRILLEAINISEKFEVITEHLLIVVREVELMKEVWMWELSVGGPHA